MTFCTKAICFAFWWTWRMPAWQLRGQVLPPCAPADQTGYLWTPGHNLLCCPVRWWIGTSPKSPYKAKKTTNRLVQRFIVLLVRSRELESLALWLKESKVHHSSNFKSSKKRYFYRIIAKYAFAHTALFAYGVMLCNCYPAIQVCKKCAKMCRRAKRSPMDKSIIGFMAGFRTSE